MTPRAAIVATAAAGLAWFAWSARGRVLGTDSQLPDAVDNLTTLLTDPAALIPTVESFPSDLVDLIPIELYPVDESTANLDPRDLRLRADNTDANRAAFLSAIAWAEGTDNAGGYRCLYGSRPSAPSLLDSFADHPAELGWPGVKLTDQQCRGAGLGAGCVSTAAGRYQITRTTWRGLGGAGKYGEFSPAAQDAAALDLIAARRALDDVDAGRFAAAVDKIRRVWASMPGAGYAGQQMRTLDQLAAVYSGAGGAFA